MVTKKSRLGRPVELNYAAMIFSLVARISERIPFIKDLVKRLKNDMIFRLDCGFLVSDSVPSEAAYSRMITIINDTKVLEEAQNTLLQQAISEGFITDDTVAIDSTHFEARDQAPPKEEKPKAEPKKRGRKSKAEREQWLIRFKKIYGSSTRVESPASSNYKPHEDDYYSFLQKIRSIPSSQNIFWKSR